VLDRMAEVCVEAHGQARYLEELARQYDKLRAALIAGRTRLRDC